jgi:hypothetical protein
MTVACAFPPEPTTTVIIIDMDCSPERAQEIYDKIFNLLVDECDSSEKNEHTMNWHVESTIDVHE